MKIEKARSLTFLAQAGLIGGMYAALCLLLAPISYGAVQVRVAEVLTVLPAYTPAAVPGLTVGCLLANLFGGGAAGGWDWLFGTMGTLMAAQCSYALRRITVKRLPLVSTLPPILINALVVGAECAWMSEGGLAMFWLCAAQVAAGQTIACAGGGLLLASTLERTSLGKRISVF